MKKGILLAAVILLSTAGLVQAQENELGVTLGVKYMSRFIWRGFDIYRNNDGAIRPFIDVDLYGTGFGVNVIHTRGIGDEMRNTENMEKFNYTLYYRNKLFEGETYATNYKAGWVYYNYPDRPRKSADLQEAFVSLSWPEICPEGIVPKYTVVKMWPAISGAYDSARFNGGWWHILGFDYDLSVPGLMPDTPEQILRLSAEMVYNGSVYAGGKSVDHDWSHAVFGVSTNFDLGNNLTFTPGIYYQSSWDDSVNASDEYWTTLTVKYKF